MIVWGGANPAALNTGGDTAHNLPHQVDLHAGDTADTETASDSSTASIKDGRIKAILSNAAKVLER